MEMWVCRPLGGYGIYYCLSRNWASSRKRYSHHNECQWEFPNGCMFRAFFLKYWHFQIVSKLSPRAPGLYWMCLPNSVIVTGGPRACRGFLCSPWLPKGRDARVPQSSGPQIRGIYLQQNFLLPYPNGAWRSKRASPCHRCGLWSSPLYSLFVLLVWHNTI